MKDLGDLSVVAVTVDITPVAVTTVGRSADGWDRVWRRGKTRDRKSVV